MFLCSKVRSVAAELTRWKIGKKLTIFKSIYYFASSNFSVLILIKWNYSFSVCLEIALVVTSMNHLNTYFLEMVTATYIARYTETTAFLDNVSISFFVGFIFLVDAWTRHWALALPWFLVNGQIIGCIGLVLHLVLWLLWFCSGKSMQLCVNVCWQIFKKKKTLKHDVVSRRS